jgi:hypothetical protein
MSSTSTRTTEQQHPQGAPHLGSVETDQKNTKVLDIKVTERNRKIKTHLAASKCVVNYIPHTSHPARNRIHL